MHLVLIFSASVHAHSVRYCLSFHKSKRAHLVQSQPHPAALQRLTGCRGVSEGPHHLHTGTPSGRSVRITVNYMQEMKANG